MSNKVICTVCKLIENVDDLYDDVNDEGSVCDNCFSLNSFITYKPKTKKKSLTKNKRTK